MNNHRRKLLLTLAGGLAMNTPVLAKSLLSTPSQTAGPYYPETLPLDDDNDLTQVQGRSGQANGLISDVAGKIIDINGHPLKGLRIEIWQCDANGRYRHPRENSNRSIDSNFQGHGHFITDSEGGYRFRTIRPVHYPGRTPHIHVAVFSEWEPPFITQLYIKNEPLNQRDYLFNNIADERRHLVEADFTKSQQPGADQQAQFNIILNRTDGTPMQS